MDLDNNMMIKYENEIFKYKLIHTLEFNSTRKRMSVIVQNQLGEYILYCKGADSIILERMQANQENIK